MFCIMHYNAVGVKGLNPDQKNIKTRTKKREKQKNKKKKAS